MILLLDLEPQRPSSATQTFLGSREDTSVFTIHKAFLMGLPTNQLRPPEQGTGQVAPSRLSEEEAVSQEDEVPSSRSRMARTSHCES